VSERQKKSLRAAQQIRPLRIVPGLELASGQLSGEAKFLPENVGGDVNYRQMATQKELAKLARVSAGTVSNVISGSTQVGEETRKKVLAAIRTLNYHPNLIARSLKTNRTNTLGIIVPDLTVPFFPKVIRGAEAAASERGYLLIVLDSENQHSREKKMLALLRSQRVDGILLVAAGGLKWSEGRAAEIAAGPPVVCLDRLPDGLDVDSVCADDRSAAGIAVSHLLAMGHRKIAILIGPPSLRNEQERLRGYRQAVVFETDTSQMSRHLFERWPKPDGGKYY